MRIMNGQKIVLNSDAACFVLPPFSEAASHLEVGVPAAVRLSMRYIIRCDAFACICALFAARAKSFQATI